MKQKAVKTYPDISVTAASPERWCRSSSNMLSFDMNVHVFTVIAEGRLMEIARVLPLPAGFVVKKVHSFQRPLLYYTKLGK